MAGARDPHMERAWFARSGRHRPAAKPLADTTSVEGTRNRYGGGERAEINRSIIRINIPVIGQSDP